MTRERKKATAAPLRRSRRHEATTADTCRLFQLPNALIFDIFSRLPITDLLLCRCVCKRFLCFISDHEFACVHLSRSPLCILFNCKPAKEALRRLQSAHVYANVAKVKFSKLDFTANVPTCDFRGMSACNGLICFVGPKTEHPAIDSFYVCNPILGEFITITLPYKEGSRSYLWGLGYSSATSQYKVLQSYLEPESDDLCVMAEIYTLGTREWRSIEGAPTDVAPLPFNAFLNGALHWCNAVPKGGEFIHSFDFDTEKFRTVPTPDQFREEDGKYVKMIGVLGGCLFITHSINSMQFDIWVMKDYGVKESWTKQFVIKNYLYSMGYRLDYYQPIAVLSNGELLMMYNYQSIFHYNQRTQDIGEVRISQKRRSKIFRWFDATAYTPSFVSLCNVAKGERISRMLSSKVSDKIIRKEKFLWV